MLRREGAFWAWRAAVAALSLVAAACAGKAANFPWGGAEHRPQLAHADVRTLNDGYSRTSSQVWVREVARPTRAALDYAAYHANFMIAEPAPETPITAAGAPDTSRPFGGLLEKASLTGDVTKTPLSPSEQQHALAFAPLSEFLQARKVAGAEALVAFALQPHDRGEQLLGRHGAVPRDRRNEARVAVAAR